VGELSFHHRGWNVYQKGGGAREGGGGNEEEGDLMCVSLVRGGAVGFWGGGGWCGGKGEGKKTDGRVSAKREEC